MHRKHQRRRDAGQDQVGHLVIAPVAVGATPPHREKAVEKGVHLLARCREPVAQQAKVRNHADIPEQHRNRAVSRHREHVPLQRRAEILPDAVRVRERKEVPGQPHPPDVEQREDAGANHRENRHGLGGAVNRRAPLLAQQAKDRGDQRAGVADADPENEIDDGPAPVDRAAVSPHADPDGHKIDQSADRE